MTDKQIPKEFPWCMAVLEAPIANREKRFLARMRDAMQSAIDDGCTGSEVIGLLECCKQNIRMSSRDVPS